MKSSVSSKVDSTSRMGRTAACESAKRLAAIAKEEESILRESDSRREVKMKEERKSGGREAGLLMQWGRK